jgi:hypothetical protein
LREARVHAFEALFAASSQTILEVAARRGLRPGVLAVLHTWTQRLEDHPHTHCLVSGGGLGQDGIISASRYLFPIKILRYVFKIKLLQKLRGLFKEGKLSVARYSAYQLLRDADSRTWNVDVRRPVAGPEQVIKYFARYTRRIAISDRRLVGYDGNTAVFRYRDRKDGNRVKTDKLDGPRFCRRFLSHVLPHRFVRIRRYGILSNRLRELLIEQCRDLLGAEALHAPTQESRSAACFRIFGIDPERCPKCHQGRLAVRAIWRATRLPLDAVLATLMPRAPERSLRRPCRRRPARPGSAPLELRLFLPGYCPRGFGRAPTGPRIHRRLRDHDLAPRFLLAAALPLPRPPTTPGFE